MESIISIIAIFLFFYLVISITVAFIDALFMLYRNLK